MAPSTRLAGYRCSLPGLAGFAGVPSPGAAPYLAQNGAEIQHDRGAPRGTTPPMGEAQQSKKESKLKVGAKAPAFSLHDQSDTRVRLADFKGRPVVVYFYPKADTPGCTTQACELQEALPALRRLKAVVVGVSPDPPEKQKRFADKYGLRFPLLADEDHKVAQAWGTWGNKTLYGRTFKGIIRSAFVIDPAGKVAATFYKVSPKATVEKVTGALREMGR